MPKKRALSYKERLACAIDRFEKDDVNPAINDLKITFVVQTGYMLAVIPIGIFANLSPNVFSVIGSVGLGTLGIKANFDKFQNALTTFQNDRHYLKHAVTALRTRLDCCSDTNRQALRSVERLLNATQKDFAASRHPKR